MNQICNKCSEYASICVHMADERETQYISMPTRSKPLTKTLLLLQKIREKLYREEMLTKYCRNHKFYNAWDL